MTKMKINLAGLILTIFLISSIEGTNNLIRKWRRNLLLEPEKPTGLQVWQFYPCGVNPIGPRRLFGA